MTLNGTMKKALALVVVAIILFLISGFDSIEIVGNYKMDDDSAEELYGMDDELVSLYMNFALTGTLSTDIKFSRKMEKELKEELGDEFEERMDEMEKELSEASKGSKWSLDGGKIELKFGEEDEEEGYYILKGSELTLYESKGDKEDDRNALELEKTFLSSLTCPTALLRIVAAILILVAACLFLKGNKGGKTTPLPSDFSGRSVITARCKACGSPINEGTRFCDVCGSPADSETASAGLISRCASCGSPMGDGVKFCDTCGAPAGDVVAPPAPAAPVHDAPVYEEPAPVAPAYEAPVYTPPVETSEVSAPAPVSTPAYEPAPTAAPKTKPASDHSRFSAAGDL